MSIAARPSEREHVGREVGGQLLRVPLDPSADDATRALVERLVDVAERLAIRCTQLQEALDSRIVIEQAKGVLAERLGVAPDDAFVLLRRAARSSRMRIHDLAEEVVSSPTTPAAFERFL